MTDELQTALNEIEQRLEDEVRFGMVEVSYYDLQNYLIIFRAIKEKLEKEDTDDEENKMIWSHVYDAYLCPHCKRKLTGYDGLRKCYCKYCGGKIKM